MKASKAPVKKAPAKQTPAKKASVVKTPAKKASVVKTPAKKTPVKKTAKSVPAKKTLEAVKWYYNLVGMHVLPVSGEFYLDAIERGEKTLEGRVNHKRVQNIEKEAIVNFFDSKSNKGVVVGVIDKRHYNSFKEMLQAEDPVKLLPQLAEKKLTKAKLVSEGEKIYKAFPGAEREKDLGVVCLEIKFIKRVNSTKII